MLAPRPDPPLDRLDDAVLLADLVAARAPDHVAAETVDVALESGERSIDLRVGPLRRGGGRALGGGARARWSWTPSFPAWATSSSNWPTAWTSRRRASTSSSMSDSPTTGRIRT